MDLERDRLGTERSPQNVSRPHHLNRMHLVSKLLRAAAAGYGAKKLGGGCLTTLLVFILLWWLLGNVDLFR